jgi:rare lipoprotein A
MSRGVKGKRPSVLNYLRVLLCCAAVLTFSACGVFSSGREQSRVDSGARMPPTAKGGGYYLDDGPGENPPANLDAIPDAAPRVEPLHRGAMRPYSVMGRNYAPMTAVEPYRARGVASWYGRRYHGKLTSSGEAYDMYGMSAAHPTLPLPSYVRVTSVASGKSVIVRVNDRGPFIDSRLIDLSYTAAYKLGMLAGGSALVEVEAIIPGVPASPVGVAPPPSSVPDTPVPVATERQIPLAAEASGVHLQLAAFGSKENAEAYASRLRGDLAWLAGQLQVYARDGLFRVLAGPYPSQGEARQAADRISQSMGAKPFVFVR